MNELFLKQSAKSENQVHINNDILLVAVVEIAENAVQAILFRETDDPSGITKTQTQRVNEHRKIKQ